MSRKTTATAALAVTFAAAAALAGCAKVKQPERQTASAKAQAKRQQVACASSNAYDRLKGRLFDSAISARNGDRTNLDTLADYSLARVEEPVVTGWDPALDVIRCKGRFILEFPPGAERAFGGERRLVADVNYTAQAAADGNGLVYQVQGAEPIVTRLAQFNLAAHAFGPPPAIDQAEAAPQVAAAAPAPPVEAAAPPVREVPPRIAEAQAPARAPRPKPSVPVVSAEKPVPPVVRVASAERQHRDRRPPQEEASFSGRNGREADESAAPARGGSGAGAIRAFYGALGQGNGASAAGNIVPEKRSSRPFSPDAMSRFYGHLAEPIRVTGIKPLGDGSYRVNYRYSAGRSHCNGGAVVRTTSRDGRDFIQSIRALSGC